MIWLDLMVHIRLTLQVTQSVMNREKILAKEIIAKFAQTIFVINVLKNNRKFGQRRK